MFQEISEQPEILEKIWGSRHQLKSLAAKIPARSNDLIVFTAFGSSYNAALYGQLLLYRYLGVLSLVKPPGFFLNGDKKMKAAPSFVIAISQSGEVNDVIEAVVSLKRKGARTLGITNNPNSSLAKRCHDVIDLSAGKEKSVPATKTFTSTLFHLQLLIALRTGKKLLSSLGRVPDLSRQALAELESMKRLSHDLETRSRGFVLASESLRPIAVEGSLKLNECAYFMAEPFGWKEFFHGPIAMAGVDTPAIILEDPMSKTPSQKLVKMLKKINVPAFPLRLTHKKIDDPELAAVPFTILLQLLALALAHAKGRNPDHPRYLHKITQASF